MKDNKYELDRHNLVLERISNAKSIKELPNITLSSLARFLADNVYFDKRHLKPSAFKPFIIKMIDNGMTVHGSTKDAFIDILANNYPNHSDAEFDEMYQKILGTGRIYNMFIEMSIRGQKIQELQDEIDLEKHNNNMDMLRKANTIEEVEKISITDLESLIIKDTKNEIVNISKDKLVNLRYLIYNQNSINEIEAEIINICKSFNLTDEDYEIMLNQIISGLMLDKKVNYVVEELRLKERQIKSIYKFEHIITMEKINGALTIDQLPQTPREQTLAKYLSVNSKISNNDKPIAASNFANLVNLLLSGKSINNKECKDELKRIVILSNYKDTKKAYDIILDRYSSLNRINYFVEEINLISKRETEFIGEDYKDIVLYAKFNENAPKTGGNFYTLYKNYVDQMHIEENNDIELEENACGGFILPKNERIVGTNIKFYRSKIGEQTINIKENSRLTKIKELSAKQQRLIELNEQKRAEFEEQQKSTTEQLKEIQQELLKLTNDEEVVDEKSKKKGLTNE